jgi:hypothetical protein
MAIKEIVSGKGYEGSFKVSEPRGRKLSKKKFN